MPADRDQNELCSQTSARQRWLGTYVPGSEKAPTVGPGVEVCNGLILPWLDSSCYKLDE